MVYMQEPIASRYSHVDMARGIAMILVVAGHSCSSTTGDLNRMILSFHMPLFFFLSGIFAKEYSWNTVLGGVKRKMLRILVPQLLLAVLVTVMKIVPMVMLRGGSIKDFNWLYGLGYWFLPTLFFCSVLYMILTCFLNLSKRINQIVLLIIATIIIWLVLYELSFPYGFFTQYIKLVPVAFVFYLLGSLFKKPCLLLNDNNKRYIEYALLISIPLLYVISQWNAPVLMGMSKYGCFPLFLVTSFLGIFVVIELMKRLNEIVFISVIGKMSIAVYVWNFLIVVFTKGILLRVLNLLGLYTSGVHAALTFVVSMILLYFVSHLTLKYTPFFYGKIRNY